MPHTSIILLVRMATSFQDIIEAYNIRLDIDIWIGYAISYSSLSCKVNDNLRTELKKNF